MTITKTNIAALSLTLALALIVFAISAGSAFASVEKVDGFVCPVISTENVLNSPKGVAIGEDHYSIIGPDVSVPVHATNGDGVGTPGGPHSEPGDTDYTAVWAK